jgi:mono/diheme cytochrome c family protein
MWHTVVQRRQLLPRLDRAGVARALRGLPTTLAGSALVLGSAPAFALQTAWIPLNQGPTWTADARSDFYGRDQGSRLIPLRWIVALKQSNGAPFMADSLARYGYLPNETSSPPGLPVGFTVSGTTDGESLGLTCAACHTRQINVQGKSYRVDGGPAIVDIEGLLTDLDQAVGKLLTNTIDFEDFSRTVLGPSPTNAQSAALSQNLHDWYLPFHTIVSRGAPQSPWGPGRLDAISMIFNRLTGLDIGPPPTYIIEDNIQRADAPVRYPFLWNAWRQDKTQWPGFADNGNPILGLGRNVGEVTGVFSAYHPTKDGGRVLGINYVGNNSTNFDGLIALEKLIQKIGPPTWRWPTNAALAAQGSKIFAQNCAQHCHAVKVNLLTQTWVTPVQNVGTDAHEWTILDRKVDPGVLAGASIPGLSARLQNPESAQKVLSLSVIGSIIQHAVPVILPNDFRQDIVQSDTAFTPETEALKGAFRYGAAVAARGSYESRVLKGIWAAAPYLHNGSVPTLAELLKPAAERVTTFKIGPNYDLDQVGLAVEQTAFTQLRQTTDCADIDSGNSRCGHEFGTKLSADQKKALLEYLKTL